MTWYVLLHKDSGTAQALDSLKLMDIAGHPALMCSAVDSTNIHYLALRLIPTHERQSEASEVLVPHHAVVAAYRGEPDQARVIGFLPA